MATRYEVCDHCAWNGPVNKDGTMRKHRKASGERRRGSAGQVQDMAGEICPGSHQPPVTFGFETPTEGAMEAVTEAGDVRFQVKRFDRRYYAVYDSHAELDVAVRSKKSEADEIADKLNGRTQH
ncbi:MAG TPA: hypothetical protein VFU47_03965 [Armatimonadota bacterium]|nr:hypothetical protein [Armatimonadota bacterium]